MSICTLGSRRFRHDDDGYYRRMDGTLILDDETLKIFEADGIDTTLNRSYKPIIVTMTEPERPKIEKLDNITIPIIEEPKIGIKQKRKYFKRKR